MGKVDNSRKKDCCIFSIVLILCGITNAVVAAPKNALETKRIEKAIIEQFLSRRPRFSGDLDPLSFSLSFSVETALEQKLRGMFPDLGERLLNGKLYREQIFDDWKFVINERLRFRKIPLNFARDVTGRLVSLYKTTEKKQQIQPNAYELIRQKYSYPPGSSVNDWDLEHRRELSRTEAILEASSTITGGSLSRMEFQKWKSNEITRLLKFRDELANFSFEMLGFCKRFHSLTSLRDLTLGYLHPLDVYPLENYIRKYYEERKSAVDRMIRVLNSSRWDRIKELEQKLNREIKAEALDLQRVDASFSKRDSAGEKNLSSEWLVNLYYWGVSQSPDFWSNRKIWAKRPRFGLFQRPDLSRYVTGPHSLISPELRRALVEAVVVAIPGALWVLGVNYVGNQLSAPPIEVSSSAETLAPPDLGPLAKVADYARHWFSKKEKVIAGMSSSDSAAKNDSRQTEAGESIDRSFSIELMNGTRETEIPREFELAVIEDGWLKGKLLSKNDFSIRALEKPNFKLVSHDSFRPVDGRIAVPHDSGHFPEVEVFDENGKVPTSEYRTILNSEGRVEVLLGPGVRNPVRLKVSYYSLPEHERLGPRLNHDLDRLPVINFDKGNEAVQLIAKAGVSGLARAMERPIAQAKKENADVTTKKLIEVLQETPLYGSRPENVGDFSKDMEGNPNNPFAPYRRFLFENRTVPTFECDGANDLSRDFFRFVWQGSPHIRVRSRPLMVRGEGELFLPEVGHKRLYVEDSRTGLTTVVDTTPFNRAPEEAGLEAVTLRHETIPARPPLVSWLHQLMNYTGLHRYRFRGGVEQVKGPTVHQTGPPDPSREGYGKKEVTFGELSKQDRVAQGDANMSQTAQVTQGDANPPQTAQALENKNLNRNRERVRPLTKLTDLKNSVVKLWNKNRQGLFNDSNERHLSRLESTSPIGMILLLTAKLQHLVDPEKHPSTDAMRAIDINTFDSLKARLNLVYQSYEKLKNSYHETVTLRQGQKLTSLQKKLLDQAAMFEPSFADAVKALVEYVSQQPWSSPVIESERNPKGQELPRNTEGCSGVYGKYITPPS